MSVAFLYPGSGHQYRGMGRDFDSEVPAVRRFLDRCARTLGYDLRRTMFDGPEDVLHRPLHAENPSLFIEVICALSLSIDHVLRRAGVVPAAVAGRSLGEYTAAMAEGVFEIRAGFALLRRLTRMAQKDCRDHPGGLLTVFGLDHPGVLDLCRGVSRAKAPCELVTHFDYRRVSIVGGEHAALRAVKMRLRRMRGVRFVASPEAGAFHTSLMRTHAEHVRRELRSVPARPPRAPIWCNATGRPVSSVRALRRNLSSQLDHSVRWREILMGMVRRGVKVFVEIAPGSMMTDFLVPLPPDVRVMRTDTPRRLRETLGRLRAIGWVPRRGGRERRGRR